GKGERASEREAGSGKREPKGPLGELASRLEADVGAALDDDLNAPAALGALFDFVRAANRELDRGAGDHDAALAVFDRVVGLLDIFPAARAVAPDLARWVEERLAARERARKARDFAEADRLRAELAARGIELEDTPSGTRWRVA
ncbi:MAG: DALR domain-containing protein, partial [Gammaproteobacteria bacterium]